MSCLRGLKMIKEYKKVATIKAEQFTGSIDILDRYPIRIVPSVFSKTGLPPEDDYFLKTLEGELEIHIGDWIATGVNGGYWAIGDDIFKKAYQEVKSSKKVVNVVQFDTWNLDDSMMMENGIDNLD